MLEKVGELDAEKMKTEKAFHDFLPTSVVREMKRSKVVLTLLTSPHLSHQGGEGSVLAQHFDCVTIFYGEIIGFNSLISDCSANEVLALLFGIIMLARGSIDHKIEIHSTSLVAQLLLITTINLSSPHN